METQEIRDGLTLNLVNHLIAYYNSIISYQPFGTGSFFDLCKVSADTSRVPKPKISNPRGSHYEVHYEVALSFGLTELKAQLVWMEDGVEKRWVQF